MSDIDEIFGVEPPKTGEPAPEQTDKTKPRVGFEIFEDGTIFEIPPKGKMKPFAQWLAECIKAGTTVSTVEVDDAE